MRRRPLEEALTKARHALYDAKELSGVPPESVEPRARNGIRSATIDQRRTRDDERRAPVDERGARDVNEELRKQALELNRVNNFLASILSSMRDGLVVVDRDLLVQNWNARAEDLWGLRSDEGQTQNLLNLDIGLPLDQLKQAIRACIHGEAPYVVLTLNATNRRGKRIDCQMTCTPMSSNGVIQGVVLVMEEIDGDHPLSSSRLEPHEERRFAS